MPPRRSPTGSGGAENPGFQAMDQTGMQNMRYVSTRGGCPPHSFPEAVMTGLAPDGGLFLPESLPDFSASLEGLQECSFQELFKRLAAPFIDGSIPDVVLDSLVERSYAVFDHPDVTPVLPVGGLYVCELFHGPTLAFKDVALQFLGNLFEHLLGRREARLRRDIVMAGVPEALSETAAGDVEAAAGDGRSKRPTLATRDTTPLTPR